MRVSSTQRVYETIKRDLLSGCYQPGDRILVEEVEDRLGVSRTPIREALLALQREGLVNIVPRQGYFARELSFREALDAYQLRVILEPIAAAMAAERVSPEELAEIQALVDVETDGSEESVTRAVDRNRGFHVRIARASGNERLAQIMEDLMDDIARLNYVELRTEHTEGSWRDEHETIVQALAQHDPAAAARTMRATFQGDTGLLHMRARAELARVLEEVGQELPSPEHLSADRSG